MQIESWWQRILQQAKTMPAGRKLSGRSTRLMEIELLENRLVPAVHNVYVTGFTDGALDTLHPTGGNNYNVANLRSAVIDHNTLTGVYNIYLQTGTYSLNTGSTVSDLVIQYPGTNPGNQNAVTITNKSGGISTISAGNQTRLFEVYGGGATTLDHLNLTKGNAQPAFSSAAEGGAILNFGNLTLTYDQIDNNTATGYGGSSFPTEASGGGVYNASGATLNVLYSTFDHNTATGGASSPQIQTAGAEGGGLAVGHNSGAVSITASTFSNNKAVGGSALGGGEGFTSGGTAFGGGISIASGAAKVTIVNSTIANNTAQGGTSNAYGGNGYGGSAFGGGISAASQNAVQLVNDTIALNTATAGLGSFSGNNGSATGGGVYNSGASTSVKPLNTIIAKNTATSFTSPLAPNDVNGTFNDLGHNLIGTTTGSTGFIAPGDILNKDPGLDVKGLQNNGGPTMTIALLQTSRAIDAGNNAVVTPNSALLIGLGLSPLSTDQRLTGFVRKSGPAVDIGAYEYQVPTTKRGRDLLYNIINP